MADFVYIWVFGRKIDIKEYIELKQAKICKFIVLNEKNLVSLKNIDILPSSGPKVSKNTNCNYYI